MGSKSWTVKRRLVRLGKNVINWRLVMIKIYRVFGQYGELQIEQLSQEDNEGIRVIIREERKTASLAIKKEDWQALCDLTHKEGDFFK